MGKQGWMFNVPSSVLTVFIFYICCSFNGVQSLSLTNADNHSLTIQQFTNSSTKHFLTLDTVENIRKKSNSLKLHMCCSMDLNSNDDITGWCKKRSPEDVFVPSESIMIPSHLMAENVTKIFELDEQKAPCLSTEVNMVYLPWPTSQTRASMFLRNGYLKVQTEYFHMDEYCINGKNTTTMEIHLCPQTCKGPRPCVWKCCGLDKVYSFGFGSVLKGCQNPATDYFSPTLYEDFEKPITTLAPHFIEKYPTSFKYECHQNKTTTFVFPKVSEALPIQLTAMPFRIRKDGQILYREPDGKCAVVDPATLSICVDGVISYNPGKAIEKFQNDPDEMVIFLCSLPPREGHEDYGGYLYGGLMIGSSFFLLLTIAVYILLWERQTVHGWTILSHTVSLYFMYIFLGTAHLIRVIFLQSSLNTAGCFAVGVLSHFFFLSTFCWLSMISVDLWLTFRAITPRRGANSKGLKRYTFYSVVGWGVPSIFVTVGWILSSEHPEDTCSSILTPAYGVYSCYLQEKSFGAYLYYPIAIMMTVNVLFFAITSVKLYMYRQSTKMATKDDTQQQFYRLFFKLFFVMGVLYIFELISWAVSGTGVFWYWAIFDVLNILRAVAVFIIFVCKPDIILALEQKYPWLKPVLIPFACIVRNKRSFSQRNTESESVNLNSSSTKQSTFRSTTRRD